MQAEENIEQELTSELVQSGAEIAGGVTGAAIGLLGGPLATMGGAAVGVVVGRALHRIGADMQRRLLGPREQTRIGATLAFATKKIGDKLNSGHIPRSDGFFEQQAAGTRPKSDELLEGVLLKARDSYEERKVALLGNLYANLVFHPEISAAHGASLIKLAGELTYRQLLLLSLGRDLANKSRLRQRDYRGDEAAVERLGLEGQSLLIELYDLHQRGLLNGGDGSAWLSVPDVIPTFNVQGDGGVLASLMELDVIPVSEKEDLYQILG